jgi:hypothetical protein
VGNVAGGTVKADSEAVMAPTPDNVLTAEFAEEPDTKTSEDYIAYCVTFCLPNVIGLIECYESYSKRMSVARGEPHKPIQGAFG